MLLLDEMRTTALGTKEILGSAIFCRGSSPGLPGPSSYHRCLWKEDHGMEIHCGRD